MGTVDSPSDGSIGLRFACQFGLPAMAIDTAPAAPVVSCVNTSFEREFNVSQDIAGEHPRQVGEGDCDVPPITVAESQLRQQQKQDPSHRPVAIDVVGDDTTSYLRSRCLDTDTDLVFDVYYGGDKVPHQEHLSVLHRVLRHDLRNGVNAIKGWTKVLEDNARSNPDKAVEAAKHILDRAEQLERISNEAGQLNQLMNIGTERQQLNLNHLIAGIVADCEQRFDAPEIAVDIPPKTMVWGNKQLRFALDNIVDNALRHNTERVTIQITATVGEHWVDLSIADTGGGLPPVEKEIITGKRQVDQLNHSSGLGLWLIKWILDQHDAGLNIKTADVPGTTFDMTLPAGD